MTLESKLALKTKIKITTTIYLPGLMLDFIFRYGSLYLLYIEAIGGGTFLFLQYILITILEIAFLVYKSNSIKQYFQSKIHDNVNVEADQKSPLFWVLFATSIFLASVALWISTSWIGIENLIIKILYTLINILLYFFIAALALVGGQTKKVKYAMFEGQQERIDISELQSVSGIQVSSSSDIAPINVRDIDSNDIIITTTLSEFNQLTSRSDTYVIESVFIGALAFSGFLTIVTSDKIEENVFELQNAINFIQEMAHLLYNYDSKSLISKSAEVYENYRLYSLLSIECLLCSSFFILVLAARLHFAKLADKAKYLIDIAVAFNLKEEELNNISYQLDKINKATVDNRKQYLSEKIEEALSNVSLIMPRIRPLFMYMTVFRNLGLYTFYLILVTSGLFFAPQFSFILIALIFCGYLIKLGMQFMGSRLVNRAINRYSKILNK